MSRSPVPGQEDFDDLPATIASGDAPSRASRATLIAGPSASSTGIAPLSPPNVFILVAALRRRFKLAMGLGPILAALAAVAAWNLVPTSKYTAKAQLQVSSTAPKVIFTTVENKVDFSTYQKTQLTLIKSKAVLNKALSDPEVAKLQDVRNQSDPSLWLERRIQADYLGEVLQISMSGDKPDDLAVLVNAVTDAYRREIVDVESKERWVRQEELQKIYNEYQANLEKRRGDMKKLATRIGSNDKQTIRYTQELAIERLATARRDLIGIQSDLRKFKAEYQIRMGHAEQEKARLVIPETTIQQYINEDAQVAQLKAKIGQLGASVGRVARVAKDATDPARLPLAADLAAHQKKLAAREAAVRSQAIEHLSRAATLEEVAALRGLRERIEVLDEQERVTREIVEAQSAENQEISQDTLYIDSIQDEIGHADSAAKRIGEELETLKVELRAPSRVKLLELADTPRKGDDKRAVITGMAGVGTFGLFLLGVAFVEFRARRISTIDEVTQSLGLRVVGSLPPNHEAYRRGLLGPRRSDPYAGNLMAESVDSLRTMLLHSTGDRAHRLIMVTSSTAGEGKTSLACHLATSLARSGMKTLLVDCDLRKPTIHRLYDLPATPGFSELLREETDLFGAIQPTTVDGPDIISAGACDPSTLKILSKGSTGAIFDRIREAYDIVILDTSPILPVTDALLIGRHVDAAIYSILRDVSRLPWTFAALERLQAMKIPVLGAVVTGVRSQPYGTYYSKGYIQQGNELS